ncbi:hypothetical protein [Hymenobacter terrestris]|uniref:Prolyl-tRNA synthetase n=1 Tax=Hymenobacter terrestris TaxID=2748310 RepID=A0ABX2Q5C7_9BACT|nr:hypothetical protein [Hymenobacter terrestris]NVO85749.1 hypothetical protein [Hymenobacter terrestris]
MKKYLPSILPALALLTLGGCAVSSNLATTENDGMYYSASDDKVTALAVPVAQATPVGDPNDVVNPDYNGSVARSGSDEYYDEERYADAPQYRNNYRGGSLGYYSFPYADPYYYGASAFGYSPYSAFGHSPYAFYDPFYRPFYGYGGLTINIGFGFGRPFYRPFGYSPYGFYDPYFAYGGFGGPWGNQFGYGNGFYGNGFYNNGFYNNGYCGVGNDRPVRNVTYGPRRSRTGTGAGLAGGSTSTASNASPGRSRVVQEGRFTTPGNSGATVPAGQYNGRSRVRDVTAGNGNSSASGQPDATSQAATRSSRYRDAQPVQGASTMSGQPAGTTRRWRVLDNSAPSSAPASGNERTTQGTVSQPERTRRATYYSGDNGSSSGTAQPQRQRTYERSSSPSRASEPSRSYSEPSRASEPSRSYSQPSRASEPSRSYSEPSRSSSPAQSSGGGDGGGGRGRVR